VVATPKKLFRIGEVMAHTGLSRQTVHNYTMLGLIHVAERTPAGHRLYGDEVFERLERVKALRGRHTLLEIKAILDADAASR
jgi:DNA-binding transcriptional MerR regulator